MKLFSKKEPHATCSCGGNCTAEAMKQAEHAKHEEGIKILGSGCKKCIALENATVTAVNELGLTLDVQHVTDFALIASYGVMSTPALVINGKVVSYGKTLSVEEVKKIIEHEGIEK